VFDRNDTNNLSAFIGRIRSRLTLIYLLPSIVLLLLSLVLIRQQYHEYRSSANLVEAVGMFEYGMKLIDSLQKERGLSVVSLDDSGGGFAGKLLRQRRRTDELFARTGRSETRFGRFGNALERTLQEQEKRVMALRKARDRHTMQAKELLDAYTAAIKTIFFHAVPDEVSIGHPETMMRVHLLKELFLLQDDVGQLRALISYLLVHHVHETVYVDAVNRLSVMMDERLRHLQREVSVWKFDGGRRLQSATLERFVTLRDRLIATGFTGYDPLRWWKEATAYVDDLYDVENYALSTIVKRGKIMKRSAAWLLAGGLVVLAMLTGLFYVFLRYALQMTRLMQRLFTQAQRHRRIHETLARFLETLLYNPSEEKTIFNALSDTLYDSGFFDYVLVVERRERCWRVDAARGRGAEAAQEELARICGKGGLLFKGLEAVAAKGRFRVLRVRRSDGLLHAGIERLGLFPIVRDASEVTVLVVGTKTRDFLDAPTILLLKKISQAMGHVFEKMQMQRAEALLRRELRISAQTFQSHEAIAITDTHGRILKVNDAFEHITGYGSDEVVGGTPRLLRSGRHDKAFYAKMWEDIRNKGHWRGEIYNRRKNGEVYPELLSISAVRDDEGIITHYVAHFFDISEMKAAQKEVEYRAQHDPLTHLFNRQKFFEELERIFAHALYSGRYYAFFYCDLDNFKQINDRYGHEAGDRALVEVGRRFTEFAGEDDVVGRISGDEFAMICPLKAHEKHAGMQEAKGIAERLLAHFGDTVMHRSVQIRIAMSAGVKVFPMSERTPKEVILDADVAMYEAKRHGKGGFRLFTETMAVESRRLRTLRHELEEAMRNGELILHYQPKVDVATRKLVGAEALLRWNHPRLGLLGPDEFLMIAREGRIGHDLHAAVVAMVCEQLEAWSARYEGFDMRVSINISAEEFNREQFAEELEALIDTHRVDAHLLDLEIVEDALLRDMDHTVRTIRRFKQQGVTFSMDDFGTGYSSLNYLKQLPVDTIKIDRSFVKDIFEPKNGEMTKMIIQTAKLFGFKTVAEGVENVETLDYLEAYGCDACQGFLFDRALEPEVFERKWIEPRFRTESVAQTE